MLCIKRVTFISLLYLYTFSKVLLTHQADGDVKRVVKFNHFLVNGRNPLTLEKCPENSEYFYLQAFGVCRKHLNDLNNETTVWLVKDHVPPTNGEDTEETLSESKNPLTRSYYKYCKTFFDKNQKCQLSINKEESGSDRFRTEEGLECAGKGVSVFSGSLFCIEKEGSPVKDGETVTVLGYKGSNVEAKCPEDRKIVTITAFELSAPAVDKGMVSSFYDEALKKCDGNEECSLSVEDNGKFKKFRLYTYKCVQ